MCVQVSRIVEIGNKTAKKEGLMKLVQRRPEKGGRASHGNSWDKIIPGSFRETNAKVLR